MIKRSLSLILCLCLALSLGVSALAANFSDVTEDSWYYNNVMRMTEMKAITGYPDGTFNPEGSITNGEFLTMLMRTLTGTESYPTDEGHWALAVLQAAYEAKVCSDADLTEADLDTPITRSMAAKYTANAVDKLLKEDKVSTKGLESLIIDYADVQSSGCEKEILDMYARGIITGDDMGRFNPTSNIKRCEAATIVLRAYDREIRQLPFGMASSMESVYSDKGVIFLSCVGEKYDVKKLTVSAVTANGINLDFRCLNSETSYKELINASSTIRKAYEGKDAPDAVIKFDWKAAYIKSLSTQSIDGQSVIDFAFTIDLELNDGTVLPFTYNVSWCIVSYGGLL